MPMTLVEKGASVFRFALASVSIIATSEVAYHRDNTWPTGILEQLNFLTLPSVSVCPTIIKPKSVLKCLFSKDFHRVGKLALVCRCHLTVQSPS